MVRIIVALFAGFVFFGAIQHYFRLEVWISVVLAAVGGTFAALGLAQRLRKILREDKTAEREKNNLIRAPTADERRKYGQSAVERTLDRRYKTSGEVTLEPNRFVADSSEDKL